MTTLRALGGGPLIGDILARNAYIDEAGIANQQQEPIVVVAGVIVHADTQWRPLHEHFLSLMQQFVPVSQQEGFVFHAKDIWHGSGKIFAREKWEGRDRRDVLRALVSTISKFQLPVVWGAASRENVAKALNNNGITNPNAVTQVAFMCAFAECASCADTWMKRNGKKECLSLVIENNNELRRITKQTYREIRHPTNRLILSRLGISPIERIIDAPSFMEKEDAPPLQLADVCAFLIKRLLVKNDVSEYLTDLIPPMILGEGDRESLFAKIAAASLDDIELE